MRLVPLPVGRRGQQRSGTRSVEERRAASYKKISQSDAALRFDRFSRPFHRDVEIRPGGNHVLPPYESLFESGSEGTRALEVERTAHKSATVDYQVPFCGGTGVNYANALPQVAGKLRGRWGQTTQKTNQMTTNTAGNAHAVCAPGKPNEERRNRIGHERTKSPVEATKSSRPPRRPQEARSCRSGRQEPLRC